MTFFFIGTTRPARSGEINGQDYIFLTLKDFRALEKSGNLVESGVYQGENDERTKEKRSNLFFFLGHYYGTPRPLKDSSATTNLFRRSNSVNEMFENPSKFLSGDLISCSLKKTAQGFGFTIIGGHDKGERFLQVKDIFSDGAAARDGRLRRGDVLIRINDLQVLGFSHTDVVKMFQMLNIGETIHLTVCRGYPLAVNIDDPQIDLVSVNGVHQTTPGLHTVRIRKGEHGFGFTIANSPTGQRVKSIFDRQRCQNLCEDDLLISINGENLQNKDHADVVDMLINCLKDSETIFVIRRGKISLKTNLFDLFLSFLFLLLVVKVIRMSIITHCHQTEVLILISIDRFRFVVE